MAKCVLKNSAFYLLMNNKMKITLEDVIEFIIKNSEETEWMDKINNLTFPFTSKFKRLHGDKRIEIRPPYRRG